MMASVNKYVEEKDRWLVRCLMQVILIENYREIEDMKVKIEFLKENTLFPYASVEESFLLNGILGQNADFQCPICQSPAFDDN